MSSDRKNKDSIMPHASDEQELDADGSTNGIEHLIEVLEWGARNEYRWIDEEDVSKRWKLYFEAAVEDGIMTKEEVRDWTLRWASCATFDDEPTA